MSFEYAVQDKPRGLVDDFIVGEKLIGTVNVTLVLGDNIFHGYGFTERLESATNRREGPTIFGYHVLNLRAYGAAEFDNNNVISIW